MAKQNNKEQQTDQVREELQSTMIAIKNEIDTAAPKEVKILKLYAKMNAIMSAVTYIQKDKKNDFHQYSYASEEAIKKAIQKELIANKVLFLVTDTNIAGRLEAITDKGKKSYLTTLNVKYRFIDVETGAKIKGTFQGDGNDSADKGIYKALTGAIKYILTSNFLIPTGADPEQHDEDPKTKTQDPPPQTNAPPQQPPPKTPGSSKPWMKDEKAKQMLAKIPNADIKQLAATEAWVHVHRCSNVNKFALQKAIAERKNKLDGTKIPMEFINQPK